MTFPPPDRTDDAVLKAGNLIGVALAWIVSTAINILCVAGAIRLGAWVAGFGELVSFRTSLGLAVAYYVWRVIDVVTFRRNRPTQ